MSKNIAWVSAETMTKDQIGNLRQIYGDVTVTQVKGTFGSAEELADIVANYDIIAVMVPTNLLPGIVHLAGDKPVIRPVNRVEPKCMLGDTRGQCTRQFEYVHDHWERVEKCEICTTPLTIEGRVKETLAARGFSSYKNMYVGFHECVVCDLPPLTPKDSKLQIIVRPNDGRTDVWWWEFDPYGDIDRHKTYENLNEALDGILRGECCTKDDED